MTTRSRAAVQQPILTRIKALGETDERIAVVAGVDRTLVSRWRRGSREMRVGELARLAQRFGADVVLSPVAGYELPAAEELPSEDPVADALEIVTMGGNVAARTVAAMRNGRLDPTGLAVPLAAIVQRARRLGARARSGT